MSQVEAVHHSPRGYGATEVRAWSWPSCGAAVAELVFIVYLVRVEVVKVTPSIRLLYSWVNCQ
jgi:hypothetical protein